MDAAQTIDTLELSRHPEGGWYRETWRADAAPADRSAGTAIYYLLEAGETSHWHRIDAAELWHFYAGAPLELTRSADGHAVETLVLGPDVAAGQRPQILVPPRHWQTARSRGSWTLAGCTVVPGFEFSGFELAPPQWRPSGASV